MGDIYCFKCGEPWDTYGAFHGDLTKKELKRLLNGDGCPCCKGKKKISKKESEKLCFENADELIAFLE